MTGPIANPRGNLRNRKKLSEYLVLFQEDLQWIRCPHSIPSDQLIIVSLQ